MQRIQFVALGSVWLDEIQHEGQEPIRDIVGGSLTYATLGARFFLSHNPARLGMLLKVGQDFPEPIVDEFRSWDMTLQVRRHDTLPSARGIVSYAKANRNRTGFQRLTSPMPVTWAELSHTPQLASPVAVEIFSAAEDVIAQFPAQRQEPCFVVWEPHAKTCVPATRELHAQACERADVFSPNHEELAAFFPAEGERSGFERATVEAQAAFFLQPRKCVVVRCAEHGCLVLAHGEPAVWLPSFFDEGKSAQCRIMDATGAGNAFLGAFAVGWLETASHIIAAQWGTVAASFAMEQVGLPQRQETLEGEEVWNGVSVMRRLDEYRYKIQRR